MEDLKSYPVATKQPTVSPVTVPSNMPTVSTTLRESPVNDEPAPMDHSGAILETSPHFLTAEEQGEKSLAIVNKLNFSGPNADMLKMMMLNTMTMSFSSQQQTLQIASIGKHVGELKSGLNSLASSVKTLDTSVVHLQSDISKIKKTLSTSNAAMNNTAGNLLANSNRLNSEIGIFLNNDYIKGIWSITMYAMKHVFNNYVSKIPDTKLTGGPNSRSPLSFFDANDPPIYSTDGHNNLFYITVGECIIRALQFNEIAIKQRRSHLDELETQYAKLSQDKKLRSKAAHDLAWEITVLRYHHDGDENVRSYEGDDLYVGSRYEDEEVEEEVSPLFFLLLFFYFFSLSLCSHSYILSLLTRLMFLAERKTISCICTRKNQQTNQNLSMILL